MQENKTNFSFFGEKIETLRDRILEECKSQSFTVHEFDYLIASLNRALDERRNKIYTELF